MKYKCAMEIAAKFSSCLPGHKGNLFEWLFVCLWNYMGTTCPKTIIFFLSLQLTSHFVWIGLVLFGFARFVLCCFMCLCRAVNETWKNDNKYYNQISTRKMTNSRKLHGFSATHHILTSNYSFRFGKGMVHSHSHFIQYTITKPIVST